MFTTRVQIRIILSAFFLIAAVSVWVTYFGTRDHDRDHLSLTLTDRQTDIAQSITWLVIADPTHPELENSIVTFENNIRLLRMGGDLAGQMDEAITFDREYDEEILTHLNFVSAAWVVFRDDVRETVTSSESVSAQEFSNFNPSQNNEQLLATLDGLKRVYSQHMEEDLSALKRSQILLLLVAAPLLAWAFWIIRYRIVRPSDFLTAAISNAPLDEVVRKLPRGSTVYADEVSQLWRSFDEMRPKIEAASRSLEQEVTKQTKLLMKAFEASQELVGQLELNTLLKLTTQKTASLLQANSAAVCLVDEDGSFLELVSASGKVAARIGFEQESDTENQVMLIGPANSQEGNRPCQNCAFFQARGEDSCLSTPLKIGQNNIGSICVVRDLGKPYDSNDRLALNLLGDSAAVAISNARLSSNTRFQTKQQAIQAERERLTAELHDSLGQTLSYLNLKVNRARALISATETNAILSEIEEIQTATNTAYGQVRNALSSLQQPLSRDEDSTYQELINFLAEYRKTTNLLVTFQIDKSSFQELAPLIQKQTIHIVREAFTNVYRHARASQVNLNINRENDNVCFTIEDDGIGFDPDLIDRQTHLGVSIMQARAQRCGGNFMITSEPGKGSIIKACFG